jgi:hypothetical protein
MVFELGILPLVIERATEADTEELSTESRVKGKQR